MSTFKNLYSNILEQAAKKEVEEKINNYLGFDKTQLDCLLNPKNNPANWKIEDYIKTPEDENKVSKDTLKMMQDLKTVNNFAYVLVAPAFLGQFSSDVTPGKLRNAFKSIGFDGMVEVAVFADILTLKEALEFDKNILTETDYQLTSCCCPMWLAMIRKVYSQLIPHVPATVSPMIAAGRTVKILHPGAMTVFIGPCIAKKAEAKEPGLAGAIDHVLTFQETKQLLELLEVKPEEMQDSEKEFSSKAGRIYARCGGVSEAVEATLKRLNPHRKIRIKSRKADGVAECKAMLSELMEGKASANFFEGMGCKGGCVGGPKSLIDKEEATVHVNEYGSQATYETPIDNPYVVELLHRLGFDTPESLMEDNKFFTRQF